MSNTGNTENGNPDSDRPREESLDAVRRHICQVLGFDYAFIDLVSGHEITNVASFSAESDDEPNDFIASLTDEHKQPLTVANTLLAQKIVTTRHAWIGRCYSPEDLADRDDDDDPTEARGLPYAIVPIIDTPEGDGQVRGMIRVLSFDASREIENQDLITLRLMGEHLATQKGIIGNAIDSTSRSEGERLDLYQVLIVHSDRLARRRFGRVLGKSYGVLEADTSERALEMLEEDHVDIILLDNGMDGTTGIGFCSVIKNSDKWKHIPVILIVTENTPSARVEGLNAGADDCIPDTCFETELSARVRSSLRHRKTERELSVQLSLLEDYAQRLEKAHEQLNADRQLQAQRSAQIQQFQREQDILRNQDNLLHRISNIIRSSFDIESNLKEMLEALSGWFALDCCFIVLPSEEEQEDTIRADYFTEKDYRVVDRDKDLETLRIFRENFDADQTVIANDVANDRKVIPFKRGALSGFPVKSLFYVPITYEQKLLGLLCGYRCAMKASWSRINEMFMKSVADQVAAGVVNARLYARVQRQATTDGLTGLFNHRVGQEKLAEQLKMAERYQRHASVIMLDVDHFKSINDSYGHPAGDTVLKTVAKLIKSNCRDVDIPVRYGGEEFLLVLPEINQEGAVVVAERIRNALQQLTINHEGIEINVTGSFGVASFPDDAELQQQLLDLADKALYLSKRLGRNQVHTAGDLMFENVPSKETSKTTAEIARDLSAIGPETDFKAPEISEEARQQEELVPEVVEMVKTLAASLYARSDYNKQHHLEVARMSELLAKVMGLSGQQVEQIRVAGLLHDVGVLKLPQEIIEKEGSLSEKEREMVNQHPVLGAQLLRPVRALRDICEILENHHERWDGTGYPKGLKGEEIPLPARIVAIVDSYHAMISARPYRDAMSHEEAMQALQVGAGKQWDPFLVEIFAAVIRSMQESTPRQATAPGAPQQISHQQIPQQQISQQQMPAQPAPQQIPQQPAPQQIPPQPAPPQIPPQPAPQQPPPQPAPPQIPPQPASHQPQPPAVNQRPTGAPPPAIANQRMPVQPPSNPSNQAPPPGPPGERTLQLPREPGAPPPPPPRPPLAQPPYPGQPAPVQPVPGQPIQRQPVPGQPVPGQPVPGQPVPGQPVPGQPVPGQPVPGQPVPGQPVPVQPVPGQPVPGQHVPGQPVPGQHVPGQPVPGQHVPGQPVSGQPVPGQSLPGQPPTYQQLPQQPQQPQQSKYPHIQTIRSTSSTATPQASPPPPRPDKAALNEFDEEDELDN
ncbi:MAG: diguanylate cyclase [Candidatus Obscuribacterales bacterium]